MSEIIAALHAQWEAQTGSRYATPAEREEMRRAFYSGFIACLIYQLNEIATIEDDDEAMAKIDVLQHEAELFFQEPGQAPRPFPHRRGNRL